MLTYKTTKRSALEESLMKEQRPLLVKEIRDILNKRGLILDESTVYRNLNNLVEQGKVRKILLLERKARFEWVDRHHHHFVCKECQEIIELENCDLSAIAGEMAKQYKIKVLGHNFELIGICSECSNKLE